MYISFPITPIELSRCERTVLLVYIIHLSGVATVLPKSFGFNYKLTTQPPAQVVYESHMVSRDQSQRTSRWLVNPLWDHEDVLSMF